MLRSIPRRVLVFWTVVSALVAVNAGLLFNRLSDRGPKVEERIHLTTADEDRNQVIPAGPSGGEIAPAIQLPHLDTGLGSLLDHKGTPVVVNFFSTTCAPCVKEMPALQRVHAALGGQVAFVGVALQNSPSEAKELVDQTGIHYEVLVDRAGKLWTALGGTSLPTTFLLSASGEVVDVHPGALTEQAALALVRSKLLS